MTEPILFFDGECNLCNGAVQFVIRHDRVGRVHFSALQSERGRAAREAVSDKDFSSIILWHEGRYSVMSEAGLAVCGYLDWPWTWLRFLRVLPRGWRDAAYRFVAAHRYKWFGRSEFCMMPTPELRQRFLD